MLRRRPEERFSDCHVILPFLERHNLTGNCCRFVLVETQIRIFRLARQPLPQNSVHLNFHSTKSVKGERLQSHSRLLLRGEAAMRLAALGNRLVALAPAVQDGADISSG